MMVVVATIYDLNILTSGEAYKSHRIEKHM